MGTRLHGISITLYDKVQTGTDGFNRPTYTETAVNVDNVLVGQPTSEQAVEVLNVTGKRAAYVLGIPKGDTHDWKDKKVSWTDAYGNTHIMRTFGFPITGIEENIPGPWHMKVRCEEYGG